VGGGGLQFCLKPVKEKGALTIVTRKRGVAIRGNGKTSTVVGGQPSSVTTTAPRRRSQHFQVDLEKSESRKERREPGRIRPYTLGSKERKGSTSLDVPSW